LGSAAVVVLAFEFITLKGGTAVVGRLDGQDRVELYKQITTISASLLGFLIAAVAILVSLDPNRKIVDELKRGKLSRS
jgi:hypothetical protein